MRPFDSQRILLGVTSGTASYGAAWLARRPTRASSDVDVVLARAASDFTGAATCEELTGRPVHTALIAPGRALNHIALARAAQLVVVLPVTADLLARAVSGLGDNLLSACLLATRAPASLVPVINDRVRAHPQVRRNAWAARAVGYHVRDRANGALAAGAGSHPGRMPDSASIKVRHARLLERPAALEGRSVLTTAGPPREATNPIRFRSNRSSERMGVTSACAEWRRGAEVTRGMAAAPADFTVAAPANNKIKKSSAASSLALLRTDRILFTIHAARPTSCATVGFALKTDDARAEAHRKLADNGLNLIVTNDALEEGAGFAVDLNRVTIVHEDGREEGLSLQSKTQLADQILDRVEVLPHGR